MFKFPIPNIQNLNIPCNKDNKDNKDNHYTTLGILQTATPDEIKKVYRKLSLEYHPDRNSGDKNKAEIYKKINEAYRILSDSAERKQYDMMISFDCLGLGLGLGNANLNNIDPSQLMSMLFSPLQSQSQSQSQSPIQSEMQNIINEFANSLLSPNLNMNLFKTQNHNQNINTNYKNHNQNYKNSYISSGFSQYEYDSKPAIISRTINLTLSEAFIGCKMPISITRWIIDSDRKSEQTETIYVDIPKGIDDNEIITIANKGNRVSDTNRGNIEITINITRHASFDRNGIDLIYKKTITLKESFCGFGFDLEYIDGRVFKINNGAGNIIPVGFQKTIPKLGMRRDNDIGNLVIIFDIIYPKEFSAAQIEELGKIL